MKSFRAQLALMVLLTTALPLLAAFALINENDKEKRDDEQVYRRNALQREIDNRQQTIDQVCKNKFVTADDHSQDLRAFSALTELDAIYILDATRNKLEGRVLASFDPHGWAGTQAKRLVSSFDRNRNHYVVQVGADVGQWLMVFGCPTRFDGEKAILIGARTLERLVKSVHPEALIRREISASDDAYFSLQDPQTNATAFIRTAAGPPVSMALSLGALAALLGLSSAIGWLLINRRLRLAIGEIGEAVARIGDGDFSATLNEKRVDEFAPTAVAINAMTTRLQQTQKKVRDDERVAAWREIAHTLSHELKNPLTPIQASVENIKKAYERKLGNFDEILDESTTAVLEEVGRLRRIIDEFGQFAQLPTPKKSSLDIRQVGEHVCNLLGSERAKIVLHVPPTPVLVLGDRDQLTQVLINLVKNAVEAAEGNAEIEVRMQSTSEGVQVSVTDDGPGLSTLVREQAFKPDFTTKKEGSGLGLGISERIVHSHGGDIRFATSEDGGTSVLVTFPPG